MRMKSKNVLHIVRGYATSCDSNTGETDTVIADAPYLIVPIWGLFMALGFYLLRDRR